MCTQYGFSQPFMPGFPGTQGFQFSNPAMGCCCDPTQQRTMPGPSASPFPPVPKEIQIQQFRFQLDQLNFMKQNLEQSLKSVENSIGEIEAMLKKTEGPKTKKGA
ncbi:MAG: hypothetical protein MI892_10105 [Desulfobacterales bacterium]|nr:hypothetical protein [Desulfobacterales bacterium]